MIFMNKELLYDINYLFTCIYNHEPQSLYTKNQNNIKFINKEKVTVYLEAHRYLSRLGLKPIKSTDSQYTYLISDIENYISNNDWKAQLKQSMADLEECRHYRNNNVSISAHQIYLDVNSGKPPAGNYFSEQWSLDDIEVAFSKAKELKEKGYQDIMIMISNIGD